MASVEERIQKLSSCPSLNDWEKNFLVSVADFYDAKGKLSPRQDALLQKMESKYSPEKILAEERLSQAFTPEMREDMKIVAHYYRNNPPYFADLAKSILEQEDFVPTERQYVAMMENKYAIKVLNLAKSEPLFPDGTFALLRVGRIFPGVSRHEKNRMVLVVQHSNSIKSAAKDARPVLLLPVGSTTTFWAEERDLKPTSRKRKEKKDD